MLSPHELIAQRDHVPNDNERGGRDTGCSRPFGQRVQRAFYRFLMSPRSPLDDGSGRGVGAAVPDQSAADGRQRARGHKDD